MASIVGIDLGTTNSLCAVLENGAPRLIENAYGSVLTPSLVGALDDGRIVVGDAARELRLTRPERVVACFKRLMGTDQRLKLGGNELSAPELSAIVLASLKHDAEQSLGEPVTDAVITVPAYFNDHQRQATRLAGRLANVNVRRILNEPTAAALTHGLHERDAEKRVLIFDLGGGTFDVTLMEIFGGNVEIIATSGNGRLGGEDFTDRLVQWALNHDGRDLETAELREPLRVARLRKECEAAKRALGEQAGAELRYPNADGSIGADSPRLAIDRAAFARLTEDLIERLAPPVERVLNDGRVGANDLHEVILVGGATRMPIVHAFAVKTLGREPVVKFDPDEVVALGAAVQAALIADDRSVSDLVMTDVCPFTLGIEITKTFGSEKRSGYYLPVLPRNTTIPVSKEEVVYTLEPNQTAIRIAIYQGEGRRVKDNLHLGELEVKGIPRGPAGQPVCVRFTYDLNGVLEVEAVVAETGARYQTVLTQHVKGLSAREVALAVSRMQALKFYPRDDLRNRKLVLFAEQVVAEISPEQRETLESALDHFESSMSSGDRALFGECRTDLLVTLSGLGHPFPEPDEVASRSCPISPAGTGPRAGWIRSPAGWCAASRSIPPMRGCSIW